MASHTELVEKFSLRDDFQHSVRAFLNTHEYEILIIMGIQISSSKEKSNDQLKRDLLILPSNSKLAQKIIIGLKSKPELRLQEKDTYLSNAILFEQGDVSYSRKKLMTIIINICELC